MDTDGNDNGESFDLTVRVRNIIVKDVDIYDVTQVGSVVIGITEGEMGRLFLFRTRSGVNSEEYHKHSAELGICFFR